MLSDELHTITHACMLSCLTNLLAQQHVHQRLIGWRLDKASCYALLTQAIR